MLELILAVAVFLLLHGSRVRTALRQSLAHRIGSGGTTAVYSGLSLLALWWVLLAAGRAPYVELWSPARWQHHLALLFMPLALVLIGVGAVTPNPFSASFTSRPFDPQRPGLLAFSRHPLLLGISLWALVHIIPNGDLVHVALFGGLAVFGVVGTWLLDRRRRRAMGDDEWQRLAQNTAFFSPSGLTSILSLTDRTALIALAVALAMGLWLAFFGLHGWLFGVVPQL